MVTVAAISVAPRITADIVPILRVRAVVPMPQVKRPDGEMNMIERLASMCVRLR
ncbi:hypothetical protein [Streptomyces sp. SAJ15]|uniref:hypothetical protein n=1 Tax=Streptomyces sp. SAJ15 TaxID=2011095 RepID=UPI00164340CB|nr:hypothetical protein [Streptomyces sp. SAJ15]